MLIRSCRVQNEIHFALRKLTEFRELQIFIINIAEASPGLTVLAFILKYHVTARLWLKIST